MTDQIFFFAKIISKFVVMDFRCVPKAQRRKRTQSMQALDFSYRRVDQFVVESSPKWKPLRIERGLCDTKFKQRAQTDGHEPTKPKARLNWSPLWLFAIHLAHSVLYAARPSCHIAGNYKSKLFFERTRQKEKSAQYKICIWNIKFIKSRRSRVCLCLYVYYKYDIFHLFMLLVCV